eukprot:GHVS01050968.1.p1 GENE.GHVS01050968.1~~GHVS01050968.1.p1  ORF type:complete len:131 (+),score=15.91 GHVS01050968.1:267-659(+)
MFGLRISDVAEMPVESMGLRKKIRQAVMTGNVTKAIACINRIEPKILEGNPELSFRLKQQQLLQLIEMGDSQQAISFAQEELAPSVKLHVRGTCYLFGGTHPCLCVTHMLMVCAGHSSSYLYAVAAGVTT